MTTVPATDGRSARAERTRDSVVNAVLELVTAGNPRPTAKEIADQAGISVRSVYVHFDDLDDLFRAAVDRHQEHLAGLLYLIDAGLPIADRIRLKIDQRVELFERFGAVRRAAQQWAPQSPAFQRALKRGSKIARMDLDRLFGAEIHDPDLRDLTLAAVDAVSGPAAWDTLRENGNSVEEARAIITFALTRLLER